METELVEADGRIMQPHQARVVTEKNELLSKAGKLHSFVNTPPFHKLTDNEQNLLRLQLAVMNEYAMILEMRIATF
jgi:hypothetical protein